jgi:mannose-6-phosphate isomerase-like protein (cupin superfamily)
MVRGSNAGQGAEKGYNMSSVILEADRLGGPAPFAVLFGPDDGATRVWMIHMAPPPEFHIGLHRHGGDEIWRVRRGRVRITVDGQHLDCKAGQLVVVPPHVSHGVMVVDSDTEAEVVGEIEMGEWITVLNPDGSSREVEAHVPFMPWHRRPPEGTEPTSLEQLQQMMETTAHLL